MTWRSRLHRSLRAYLAASATRTRRTAHWRRLTRLFAAPRRP